VSAWSSWDVPDEQARIRVALDDGGEAPHGSKVAGPVPSNKALQLPGLALPSARGEPVPRRRGLRPHLLEAVLRFGGNLALGPQLNARSLGRLATRWWRME
jgi:hypothetical protein